MKKKINTFWILSLIMICKYCLTKIDDDSVFCENCGNRVTDFGNNDETQLIPKVEEKSEIKKSNKKVPYSTDDKVDNPVSLYAATKKSDELIAHCYSKLFNIPK